MVSRRCAGFDLEHPSPLQEAIDGGTQSFKIGILNNPLTVQSQKLPGITAEIRGENEEDWRGSPALLELENLPIEKE